MVLVYIKTFLSCRKRFDRQISVKDAAKYDIQSEKGKLNVSKVRKIFEHDGRYTIFNTLIVVNILLLRVHFNLKRILKERQMDTYIDRLSKTGTRIKR